MAQAGVIGCGLMGTACARRLIEAHFEVFAYDLDEMKLAAIAEGGAQPVASVVEIVRACDTLVARAQVSR